MAGALLGQQVARMACRPSVFTRPMAPSMGLHTSPSPCQSLVRTFSTSVIFTLSKSQVVEAPLRSSHGWSHWRSYRSSSLYRAEPTPARWDYKRLALSGALVAGTVVLADGFFNRDARTTPLSLGERSLLNSSFQYTGVGLAFTALTARTLFRSGFTFKMMAMSPWAVLGLGLVGSIGSMMATRLTPPEKSFQKHAFWLAFNVCQAATLSPLYFFAPALLGRAALYTAGVVASLSYVGATARNDQFLYMGGPLLAGVTVVALSSLAPMVLPVTAIRTLAATQAVSLYGGLAVFGGFVLYDTQKILQHARLVESGHMTPDPVNESIGLILDSINIFIRLVQILAMQQGRRK